MSGRIAIRVIASTLILAGIIAYASFEARHIAFGPSLKIETPRNGSVSNSPVTEIKGQVKNIVRIKMNDREIAVDERGRFKEKFVLSSGSNVVKVEAEDRFGRETKELVQILYTEGEAVVQRDSSQL